MTVVATRVGQNVWVEGGAENFNITSDVLFTLLKKIKWSKFSKILVVKY